MDFREVKAKARTLLHEHMCVKTFCYVSGDVTVEPDIVFCRIHSKAEALGELVDMPQSAALAQRIETVPRLVFLRATHIPVRNNVYMVSISEGYRVDVIEPTDGVSVTAITSRLSRRETEHYRAPV